MISTFGFKVHQDQLDMNDVNATMIDRLLAAAFPVSGPTVTRVGDVGAGRGVFSTVLQLKLAWPDDTPAVVDQPDYLVAKLPLDGANGVAAAGAGAYRREAMAYRNLVADAPIATPRLLAVVEPRDDYFALLMEDLSSHRSVDQLVGMDEDDALAVATALGAFHRHWAGRSRRLSDLEFRRDVLATVSAAALHAGLQQLNDAWADHVGPERRTAFEKLVDAVGQRPSGYGLHDGNVTLCHGDPRADNLVFNPAGRPVLFDWQQVAVHAGEFDLAWLAATSLTTQTRRRCERSMIQAYDGRFDRYRAGFAIPGLMVLLLIQRQLATPRLRQLAAASLNRIGSALVDLNVA